ncbi:DoxX family protein [Mycolicibacterium goodii]|nr:DoxX family protein [Mycolicibacterium goodii]PJK23006.1 DoxX family membrane protein [Mycolicibacterium goodii]ULN50624.1 DoxX family membrane protein [Mycolicibacterium goodii]
MLSATFIARGVDALRNPKPAADAARPTLGMMSSLPDPVGSKVPSDAETVAKINGVVQVAGGLLLATGKMPRLTAAALALSVVPGSLGSHTFWNESDPQRAAQERREFLTDLSLIGGLIIAAADTAGKPSLAWRGRKAAHKVTASVAAALPAGAAASESLADSPVAEKLGHGLAVGAERGRELAEVARERAAELAHAAREHAPELAEAARERGAVLADIARERGSEIAEVARERGLELADVARGRSAELADVARERGSEIADVARDRAPELAEAARERGTALANRTRKQLKQGRRR